MLFNNLIKTIKNFLVVFCVLVFVGCTDRPLSELEIIYNDNKAVAISFPNTLATNDVKVYLKSNLKTAILGDFSLTEDTYKFEPVIPFSKGSTYVLYQNSKEVSSFTINNTNDTIAPEVIAVYPTTNKVPENLLKMYFVFSNPMQEVDSALDYITITHNETGKVVDVFLELTTELWNKEHTQLTLWLDPGRIKRDLIPNKEKGLPLLKGQHYTLKIAKNFKDAHGKTLQQAHKKEFTVIDRDSKKPIPKNWELQTTLDVLTLNFKESMDAALALETFNIVTNKGDKVQGDFELLDKERILKFYPKHPFALGEYVIIIESRLEDLAGNNLNHPFDKDLNNSKNQDITEVKKLLFTIE